MKEDQSSFIGNHPLLFINKYSNPLEQHLNITDITINCNVRIFTPQIFNKNSRNKKPKSFLTPDSCNTFTLVYCVYSITSTQLCILFIITSIVTFFNNPNFMRLIVQWFCWCCFCRDCRFCDDLFGSIILPLSLLLLAWHHYSPSPTVLAELQTSIKTSKLSFSTFTTTTSTIPILALSLYDL